VCSSLCTIDAHNIAQNRPDNFPSCPPDNHHCSDDVYLRERGEALEREPRRLALVASIKVRNGLIIVKVTNVRLELRALFDIATCSNHPSLIVHIPRHCHLLAYGIMPTCVRDCV